MEFADYAFASKLKDVLATIARSVIQEERPEYRYATVVDFNIDDLWCEVLYGEPGEDPTGVRIRLLSVYPAAIGQVVKVEGRLGDRHVTATVGPPGVVGG